MRSPKTLIFGLLSLAASALSFLRTYQTSDSIRYAPRLSYDEVAAAVVRSSPVGITFYLLGGLLLLYFAARNGLALGAWLEARRRPDWLREPSDVASFPPDARAQIEAQEGPFREACEREAAALTSLGLPVPRAASGFAYRARLANPPGQQPPPFRFAYDRTSAPTFAIPPHVTLRVQPDLFYVVPVAAEEAPRVLAFAGHGLAYLVRQYPGAWVSNDPYRFFKNPPVQPEAGSHPARPAQPPTARQLAAVDEAVRLFRDVYPELRAELSGPDPYLKAGLPRQVWEYALSAPADAAESLLLGTTAGGVGGPSRPALLPPSARDRHVYVVGKSGSGKSTLILNMARQDVERGYGVCVVDPHGDLVEDLLRHISRGRVADTIYLNAADAEHPIPVNVMAGTTEDEINLLADDLLVTFKRLSDSWGERMEHILRHVLHTLLRSPGATFLDIQRILQDERYRRHVLGGIRLQPLLDFWAHQYPSMPKDSAQPILSRMSKFSLSPAVSGILGGGRRGLDFSELIQDRKVLLVNLAKGRVGEDTAKLIGSVLVSQLQLAAMRRAALPREARRPYMLYVDEFQNFTTAAFQTILSEARKYGLCLTLAHQYISQIGPDLRHAILGNVGSLVVFPLAETDAAPLEHELGGYDARSVAGLDPRRHEAIYKPQTGARDAAVIRTFPPPRAGQSHAAEITEQTRRLFADVQPSAAGPAPGPDVPRHAPPHDPPPAGAHAAAPPPAAERTPAPAAPLGGLSREEKVLYYLGQAGYLSNRQIIALVFSELGTESSRKKAASVLLSKLAGEKQVGSLLFEREKILYVGRKPSVTRHDLLLRDVLVTVFTAGYQISSVQLFSQFDKGGALNPDLVVTFGAEGGGEIPTVWEYDNGTEGEAVLVSKLERYRPYAHTHKVVWVFSEKSRAETFFMRVRDQFSGLPLYYVSTEEFVSLSEPVFYTMEGSGGRRCLFAPRD